MKEWTVGYNSLYRIVAGGSLKVRKSFLKFEVQFSCRCYLLRETIEGDGELRGLESTSQR